MSDWCIRKFTSDDRSTTLDIFNYFVDNSHAAYPEKSVGITFIEKLQELAIQDSFYVVESSQKKIIGFGLIKKHHAYDVFKRTAELTYFILPEHTRRGLGSKLLTTLIEDARKAGVDTLLAHISSLNEGSIIFHEKNGFKECGRFRRIGRKKNRDFDIVWMQRFI